MSALARRRLALGLALLAVLAVAPPSEAQPPSAVAERGRTVLERAAELAAGGSADEAVTLLADFAGGEVRARRTSGALAPLALAVELAPERADLHLLRARVLGELTRFRDALASLERAIELGETSLEVRLLEAGAHWELKDYQTAEELFRRAVEGHGEAVAAHFQLGSFLLWRGRAAEAAEVLARAAELAADDVEVLFLLARAYAESGDANAAVATYERLLELRPDHRRARYLLGLLRRPNRDRGPAARPAPGLPEDASGVVLTDVSAAAGIDFRHDGGHSPDRHMPETMGAGLAWLDYDGDGWQDLYLVQSGPWPPAGGPAAADRLYRNRGPDADGRVTFEDASGRAGAVGRCYGQGATAADVDGDGDVDLYLACDGADRLLSNQGDGSFREAAAELGLGLDDWSSSAAFADLEGDGDLDLYVARYLRYDPSHGRFCGDPVSGVREYCNVRMFEGLDDRLFRQRADGTFEDVTAAAGIDAGGRGLGVVWTDLDGDRRPDLYVANDLTPNRLYRNLGDGTFEDLSWLSGAAYDREGKSEAGMGVTAGDVDGDLLPELLVTNFDVESNTLYANRGDLLFDDFSVESGFGPPSFDRLGFGLVLADLDLDGDLDAYVANGHVFARPKRDGMERAQDDLLLLGDGGGRFRPQPGPPSLSPGVGRGAAAADFDGDGDADVAVQNNGGAAMLLRNEGVPERWLGVVLDGGRRNRQAVGARLILVTAGAGGVQRRQLRQVMAGQSYQSSADRRQLFGWPASEAPRELEVVWPSGGVTRLYDPPEDRYLRLREPLPPALSAGTQPARP